MKVNILTKVIAIALILGMHSTKGVSQCKSFIAKQCMPKISPFTHNGQLNSTTLMEGETAELLMTFYSGQDYRILVCAQKILGQAQFKLLDANRNVVFDSKQGTSDFWDFSVKSTQQLIIQVSIPKPEESPNSFVQSGCVAVLIGFKP